MRELILLGWSGGKDSVLALARLTQDVRREVVALVTHVVEGEDRVSMHGVPADLVRRQADALSLPLEEIALPRGASNAEYERRVGSVLSRLLDRGVRRMAFGDLFLQDIREFRERQMSALGMQAEFPLWGDDTAELAEQFVADGNCAVVCCVDPARLDESWCGRTYDADFLRELPPGIDPCGENGEFHTFVSDGPMFERPLAVLRGEVAMHAGFWYCDLSTGVREQAVPASS